MDPDAEYNLRCIFRWYSKTFHTPLHVVPELPLMSVLQAFHEERYREMRDDPARADELREEIRSLIESDEEAVERRMREDLEEYEADQFAKFVEEQEQEADAERKKKVAARKLKMDSELQKFTEQATKVLPSLEGVVPKLKPKVPGRPLPMVTPALKRETDLPTVEDLKELPPDVSISFVSPEDFEREINGTGEEE
jgi:hypothetical protein